MNTDGDAAPAPQRPTAAVVPEDALLLLRQDGSICWANDAATALFGYTLEELCGLAISLSHLGHGPPDGNAVGPVAGALGSLLNGQAGEDSGFARFARKDQKRISVQWRLWVVPSSADEKQVLLRLRENRPGGGNGTVVSSSRNDFAGEIEGKRGEANQLRELAARSQEIREEERVRIAREIHDELGQALTLLKMDLSWMSRWITRTVPGEQRRPFEEKMSDLAQMVDNTLRILRRIISDLRPPLLDEIGLKAAIEYHMERISKTLGVRCELDLQEPGTMPPAHAVSIFRIFQEVVTNIARHAKASRIKVILTVTGPDLMLIVEDNGRGITEGDIQGASRFGILGMQERAWALGGELEIFRRSEPGTRIALRIPRGITEGPAASPPIPE